MGIVKRTTPDQRNDEASRSEDRAFSRDLAGLLLAIKSPETEVKRWAARDLAAYPEAVPQLIEQLLIDSDLASREAILFALTNIGTQEAIVGLINCLRSENTSLRNAALDSIKNFPPSIGAMIKNLLKDPDSDVRILSINILESLQHPDIESWLIDVIENDTHLNVCGAAADLLAEIGSEAAIEALIHLKQRFPDEPYIEFTIKTALRRIIEE